MKQIFVFLKVILGKYNCIKIWSECPYVHGELSRNERRANTLSQRNRFLRQSIFDYFRSANWSAKIAFANISQWWRKHMTTISPISWAVENLVIENKTFVLLTLASCVTSSALDVTVVRAFAQEVTWAGFSALPPATCFNASIIFERSWKNNIRINKWINNQLFDKSDSK